MEAILTLAAFGAGSLIGLLIFLLIIIIILRILGVV